MITTISNKTVVFGEEEVKDTLVKKVGRFLIFKTEWWETANTEHIGNDIYIKTNRPIRNVYLNGNLLNQKI